MPKTIIWSDQFCVGDPLLDAQHRKLLGLVNEVGESVVAGDPGDEVHRLLNALMDYTRIHFADEEARFRELGYAELERHQQAHAALIEKVALLSFAAMEGQVALRDVQHLLAEWWTHHILQDDMVLRSLRQNATHLTSE